MADMVIHGDPDDDEHYWVVAEDVPTSGAERDGYGEYVSVYNLSETSCCHYSQAHRYHSESEANDVASAYCARHPGASCSVIEIRNCSD